MSIGRSLFGSMQGKPVYQYQLSNSRGMIVRLISYGATISEIQVPDRRGQFVNVVAGFDNLDQYLQPHPHFGGTIGRVANRIANAKFSLGSRSYSLAANNGPHCLHGGKVGFDRVLWQGEILEDTGPAAVAFSYESSDGEEGFPGALSVRVSFLLSEDNGLTIDYRASGDQPTPVNLTNHAYFNLKGVGRGDILDHVLQVAADRYTPVDKTLIPTGEIRLVAGTPLDFNIPTAIGKRIQLLEGGYDHNYILRGPSDRPAACARDPESGRVLEVFTTEPGLQLYTGNFLDGSIVGLGGRYFKHGAFCLETQHFPDSINQPSFPSIVLMPGQTYRQVTTYRFSVQ